VSFRRIIIALDESALAAHAAERGAELGRALSAEIGLVYVIDPKEVGLPDMGLAPADLMASLKHEAVHFLEATAQRLGGISPWRFVRDGKPADEILAAAREWQADLIVIGTHGRSGVSRVVLGSTAESVVRHAPCPVVVVRGGE
jgi:nucleotide-binding universal stress UspA family protein